MGSWGFFFTTAGLPAAGSLPLSAAVPVVETHRDANGDVVAKWDGTVSYSHWQGRLLDEAKSMGLRRWAKERDGQVLQAVCRALLSRSGMFCSSFGPRRGARDAPGTKLACGTIQVEMRSRHRCDTLSGRVPRRIGEGVERVEGEIWKKLEETATKSGGEGEEQQLSAGTSTKPIANASPTAKRSQLDDWSDSPRELTKESAAAAPLPALTRNSLASAPQVPIDLGNPSTWVLGELGSWPPAAVAH